MNVSFGVYPEAWLRMQAQEVERGLARRPDAERDARPVGGRGWEAVRWWKKDLRVSQQTQVTAD